MLLKEVLLGVELGVELLLVELVVLFHVDQFQVLEVEVVLRGTVHLLTRDTDLLRHQNDLVRVSHHGGRGRSRRHHSAAAAHALLLGYLQLGVQRLGMWEGEDRLLLHQVLLVGYLFM